ncbi:hypothetical protein LPH50_10035 [Xylella taiwanensis]|uniref:Uncharacterized protein n=1 Tax=Xylella taiwanensis TaxID=1444770 RepID=Z9JJ25_9GAMM|nr:hypothetical protein [Xylella taiwanensis]EWS77968.1 hypothetical protein AF72_08410 [Xylella taiwanensis]MCD8460814.1 hypothetical protein [Xylella taiwanensis]MCD8465320.1 hypothetical protein [Xylella taiwanensis]MCD8467124.1 hypothetical protein [Xylella taiwanensis]MCD8470541.1 hypothetical protein [Xylella taiwanensis]
MLDLQPEPVHRTPVPHTAGVGQHGRCLDRRADLRAELMPKNTVMLLLRVMACNGYVVTGHPCMSFRYGPACVALQVNVAQHG